MRAVVNVALSPLKRKGTKLANGLQQPDPSSPRSSDRSKSQRGTSSSVYSVEESASSQTTPSPTSPPLTGPLNSPGKQSQPHPQMKNGSRRMFRRSGCHPNGDGSGEHNQDQPDANTRRRPFSKQVTGAADERHSPSRNLGPYEPECYPSNSPCVCPLPEAHNTPRPTRRMSAGSGISFTPQQQRVVSSAVGLGDKTCTKQTRRMSVGPGVESGGGFHSPQPWKLSPGSALANKFRSPRPKQQHIEEIEEADRHRPQPGRVNARAEGSPRTYHTREDLVHSYPTPQLRRLSAGPASPLSTNLQPICIDAENGAPSRQSTPPQRQQRRMSTGSAYPMYFGNGSRQTGSDDRDTDGQNLDPPGKVRRRRHPESYGALAARSEMPPEDLSSRDPRYLRAPTNRQTRRMSTGSADPTSFDLRPRQLSSEGTDQQQQQHQGPPPPLRQQRRMSALPADRAAFSPETRRLNTESDEQQYHRQSPPLRQQRRMSAGNRTPSSADYSHGVVDSGPVTQNHHEPSPARQPRRMSTGSADPNFFANGTRRPSTGSDDQHYRNTPHVAGRRPRPRGSEKAESFVYNEVIRRANNGSGGQSHPGRIATQPSVASASGRRIGNQHANDESQTFHNPNIGPERSPHGHLITTRRLSHGSGEYQDLSTPSSHRRIVASGYQDGAQSRRTSTGSGSGHMYYNHHVNNPSQRSGSTHGSSGSSSKVCARPPLTGSPPRSGLSGGGTPPHQSPKSDKIHGEQQFRGQQKSPASSTGRPKVPPKRRDPVEESNEVITTQLPHIPASPVKPGDRSAAGSQYHQTPNHPPRNTATASNWASFEVLESSPSSNNDIRPSAPVRSRTLESRSPMMEQLMDRTERYRIEGPNLHAEDYYDDGDDDNEEDDDEFEEEDGYEYDIGDYERSHRSNDELDELIMVVDEDDEEHEDAEDEDVENYHHSQLTTAPVSPNSKPNPTKLYEFARRCQWDRVLQECQEHARDASYVCPKDGTTALHLAVMSRCNPLLRNGELPGYKPAPRLVVEALLVACPEAAITRCAVKKYTPLTYACLVTDEGFDMSDAADMVVTILRHAPQSAYVFTDDGFSALDVHIMSYSRLHGHKEEVYTGGRTSTVVIRTLLEEKPVLAEARSYKNKIRGPLELLYRCNMDEFKDAVDNGLTRSKPPQQLASVVSQLSDWWAWKWAQLLMKAVSTSSDEPDVGNGSDRPFSVVHAAARIVGCPIPILSLAISMYPEQVEERDPRGELYNLPLHEVASWRCDAEIICGDPFVIRRKIRALELLLEEYPVAARTTNNMGETPLQLAIESGTPWHGGLELLVRACPKALKFPRRLRNHRNDMNKTKLSVTLHSDLVSVDSEDEDPIAALDGMYPFMVAAVLAHIPDNLRRDPSFLFEGQSIEEHRHNVSQKDLESIRSIYGLLRARPDALTRYISDLREQQEQQ